MNIEKFVNLRKFLYHLTDEKNLESILKERRLKSTSVLVDMVNLDNKYVFLTSRRRDHVEIANKHLRFMIRDQYPINEKVLRRSLDPECSFEQYIISLNSRVFFWPTLKDLCSHFGRYANENPVILRVRTEDLFSINSPARFCNLNSGAPRCCSYYDGNAAPRGHNTFLAAEDASYLHTQVREVTFENICNLPNKIEISHHPEGPFAIA